MTTKESIKMIKLKNLIKAQKKYIRVLEIRSTTLDARCARLELEADAEGSIGFGKNPDWGI